MRARRPPFEASSSADASDGNSSDYSRCLCLVVSCTVSFIQIRRAAHSFERDSAALAASLHEFRADADRSQVTGQSSRKILLNVGLSGMVHATRWPWLAAVRAIRCCPATWPSNAPTVFAPAPRSLAFYAFSGPGRAAASAVGPTGCNAARSSSLPTTINAQLSTFRENDQLLTSVAR